MGNGLLKWVLGIVASLAIAGVVGLVVHYGDYRALAQKVERNEESSRSSREVQERVIRMEAELSHVKEAVGEIRTTQKSIEQTQQEQLGTLKAVLQAVKE